MGNQFAYRKKPVVIQAFKHDSAAGTYTSIFPGWLLDAYIDGTIYANNQGETYIKTLEGDHLVSDGDYIIQGVKGELYPCKSDIFEMTYDKVEE